jgi:nitrogen fixation protein NifX
MNNFKIAVSSTDGIKVNEHFGRTKEFIIYEVNENGETALLEKRTQQSNLAYFHSDEKLIDLINLISDCDYVLVSQIGPGADKRLAEKGITSFSLNKNIEDAIQKIIEYRKFQDNLGKH